MITDLDNDELNAINGGLWPLFFAGGAATVAGYLAVGIVENWEELKKGMAEGYATFA